MRSLTLVAALLGLACTSSSRTRLVAMDPAAADSLRRLAQRSNMFGSGGLVVIRIPTVIAVGDTANQAQSFGSIRTAIDSLGFALESSTNPVRRIVDQAYRADYYVSPNLVLGYVIIAPGRRPVVLYGPVSPDSLRSRVLSYLQVPRSVPTSGR